MQTVYMQGNTQAIRVPHLAHVEQKDVPQKMVFFLAFSFKVVFFLAF